MTKPNIELFIEELVLHGFAAGDRYCIGDAFERELARLIGEKGLPDGLTADIHIPRIDGGGFKMAPDSTPQMAGIQVARSVHGALKGK